MKSPANVSIFQSLGVRPYAVHDSCSDEWEVRIKWKHGDVTLCGCAGKHEALAVVEMLLLLVTLSSMAFDETIDEDNIPVKVEVKNLRAWVRLKDRASETIRLLSEMMQ